MLPGEPIRRQAFNQPLSTTPGIHALASFEVLMVMLDFRPQIHTPFPIHVIQGNIYCSAVYTPLIYFPEMLCICDSIDLAWSFLIIGRDKTSPTAALTCDLSPFNVDHEIDRWYGGASTDSHCGLSETLIFNVVQSQKCLTPDLNRNETGFCHQQILELRKLADFYFTEIALAMSRTLAYLHFLRLNCRSVHSH